jgi:plastocyanin
MKFGQVWLGAVVVTVVSLGITGCKPKPEAPPATSAAAQPDAPAAPSSASVSAISLGTITGRIHFSGKAPAPVKIDMSMDPACDMSGGGDNFSEEYAVHSGNLANVFVYVKSGPPAAFGAVPIVGPAIVMDQKGCRYVPHVVGLMKGQSIEFRNSDVTMHNIHTMPTAPGSQSIDISQSPRGAPQIKQFNQPEIMIPVRCNNHPWMNAFVNVSETPFFDVSNTDGEFSIKGLPAGEYTLAAVQEKLGEQTLHVTVKPEGTTAASFTFTMKK